MITVFLIRFFLTLFILYVSFFLLFIFSNPLSILVICITSCFYYSSFMPSYILFLLFLVHPLCCIHIWWFSLPFLLSILFPAHAFLFFLSRLFISPFLYLFVFFLRFIVSFRMFSFLSLSLLSICFFCVYLPLFLFLIFNFISADSHSTILSDIHGLFSDDLQGECTTLRFCYRVTLFNL